MFRSVSSCYRDSSKICLSFMSNLLVPGYFACGKNVLIWLSRQNSLVGCAYNVFVKFFINLISDIRMLHIEYNQYVNRALSF